MELLVGVPALVDSAATEVERAPSTLLSISEGTRMARLEGSSLLHCAMHLDQPRTFESRLMFRVRARHPRTRLSTAATGGLPPLSIVAFS